MRSQRVPAEFAVDRIRGIKVARTGGVRKSPRVIATPRSVDDNATQHPRDRRNPSSAENGQPECARYPSIWKLIATSCFAQPSVEQTATLGSRAGSTVQEHRVRATPRDGSSDGGSNAVRVRDDIP